VLLVLVRKKEAKQGQGVCRVWMDSSFVLREKRVTSCGIITMKGVRKRR